MGSPKTARPHRASNPHQIDWIQLGERCGWRAAGLVVPACRSNLALRPFRSFSTSSNAATLAPEALLRGISTNASYRSVDYTVHVLRPGFPYARMALSERLSSR